MKSVEIDQSLLSNGKYKLNKSIVYYSPRYKKFITVEEGFISDGASGPAQDVVSISWWVHDWVCCIWKFDDGTHITKTMASTILYDILMSEKRWVRGPLWFVATWLFGPNPK